MALILPLMLTLFLGTADLGRFTYYNIAIRNIYHFTDVVVDHASNLVRRHGYPPIAVAPPGYRGIGTIRLGPSDEGWLCRTGYTGEVGAELVLPGTDAPGGARLEGRRVRGAGT